MELEGRNYALSFLIYPPEPGAYEQNSLTQLPKGSERQKWQRLVPYNGISVGQSSQQLKQAQELHMSIISAS